jgi:ribonuclease P/MRP protein subunit POP5
MKPIPPTLRPKKRYIAFKVFSSGDINKKDVIDAILDEALRLFGEIRTGDFGLWILEFNEEQRTGFLVCNHRCKEEVVTSLTLIGSVRRQKVSFHVLGVSGTIKSLKRKFLKDGYDMSQMKGE